MIGEHITITIGDAAYKGALPHMHQRANVASAWYRALGWAEGDTLAPSGVTDGEDVLMLSCCVIGLCWADKPLDVVSLRDVRKEGRAKAAARGVDYDPVAVLYEYGEYVMNALLVDHRVADLGDGGQALITAIRESIPLEDEVEEAKDPTEAQAAPSTLTTSPGVSDTSKTPTESTS